MKSSPPLETPTEHPLLLNLSLSFIKTMRLGFNYLPSLVRAFSKLSLPVEETTNPEKRGLLTLVCHPLSVGTIALPFKTVIFASLAFLITLSSASPFATLANGDSPSLRCDLGTYAKMGSPECVEMATGLPACLMD